MIDKKFSWVQTHKELVEYLKGKENDQIGLINLLKEAGATIFNDKDEKGSIFDLEVIDPFTFFCYIYKYGPEKQIEILQNLSKLLGLSGPEGVAGVPSANAQKVWLFPYKFKRVHNEISRLWSFFNNALTNQLTNDDFEDILSIRGVASTKLTEALFYIDPDKYFPINAPTKPYIKELLGIEPSFSSYDEYAKLLNQINEKTTFPFYQLSHEAWKWGQERKKNKEMIQEWEQLQEAYKNYVHKTGIKDELYKWQSIHHYQSIIDLNSDDFGSNIKQAISKSNNLLYSNSRGYIIKFAEYFPEEAKEAFNQLFDESEPLEDRIKSFTNTAERMLPEVSKAYGKKLNHQQDERTLSFYLAMHYPEKYPIFKDEIYQFLVDKLNKTPKKAGEKYLHYLELGEIVSSSIRDDFELIDSVHNQLNDDCYRGDQTWLIFQDCLWINKRKIPSVIDIPFTDEKWLELQVSVVRINNKDVVRSFFSIANRVLSELNLTSADEVLYASAIDKRIQLTIGNHYVTKVEQKNGSVWIGAYCFKETWQAISAEFPNIEIEQSDDYVWLVFEAENFPFDLLINDMIQISDQLSKRFEKSPYRSRLEHNEWVIKVAEHTEWLDYLLNEFYLLGSVWDNGKVEKVHDFVSNDEWINGYDDGEYDELIKQISVGSKVGVKAPFARGKESVMYIKARGIVANNPEDGKRLSVQWEKGLEKFEVPFSGGYWSTVNEIIKPEHILPIWFEGNIPRVEEVHDEAYKEDIKMKYALNTILYGPPGTGKTYNTISIAANIVKGPEESIESYQEAKVIFDREIGKTIEFITFHQNYSYEDFIQGLRPDIENNSELSFTREDGVFKLIADRALSNYKKSGKREAKKKSFNEVFEEFSQPLIEGEVEEIEVKMKKVSFFITHIGRSIEFRKASGGTQHTLSVKTLEEMYEVESTLDIQGLSSYYKPLLENLLELGRSETETELIERKNYVLIIDEINRANISRVFGELITLIEEDKRFSKDLYIPAKLPSGEVFSVPPNLFIIGTMNTADKSISLLDIALRRRFTFQAMYPDASLVKDEQSKMVLEKLNTAIIELKGHDFQIGHSYFMKEKRTLVDTMNLEVIPLLLEYFMNDRSTVEKLLKDAAFELKERVWPIQVNG